MTLGLSRKRKTFGPLQTKIQATSHDRHQRHFCGNTCRHALASVAARPARTVSPSIRRARTMCAGWVFEHAVGNQVQRQSNATTLRIILHQAKAGVRVPAWQGAGPQGQAPDHQDQGQGRGVLQVRLCFKRRTSRDKPRPCRGIRHAAPASWPDTPSGLSVRRWQSPECRRAFALPAWPRFRPR